MVRVMIIPSNRLLAIALLLFVSFADAQETPWQIAMSGGDTLYNCTLLDVRDGLLVISTVSRDSVMIDSIDVVYRTVSASFWSGAGYGAMAGVLVGSLIGAVTYEEHPGSLFNLGPGVSIAGGGLVGAVGGFTLGGIIGATSGGTETYELSKQPHRAKIMILRNLLNEPRARTSD